MNELIRMVHPFHNTDRNYDERNEQNSSQHCQYDEQDIRSRFLFVPNVDAGLGRIQTKKRYRYVTAR